ncbi:MAG: hypothetical protein CL566_01585 [Alphaproteobacteria bacterium]|nr:hypothetical protein [Alphaproteobacteria bacterium]
MISSPQAHQVGSAPRTSLAKPSGVSTTSDRYQSPLRDKAVGGLNRPVRSTIIQCVLVGNPDATVTVVEFFDYQCPYCKRMAQDLAKIAAEDPDVKVIFKEFPVFGTQSTLATRAALAADKQASKRNSTSRSWDWAVRRPRTRSSGSPAALVWISSACGRTCSHARSRTLSRPTTAWHRISGSRNTGIHRRRSASARRAGPGLDAATDRTETRQLARAIQHPAGSRAAHP